MNTNLATRMSRAYLLGALLLSGHIVNATPLIYPRFCTEQLQCVTGGGHVAYDADQQFFLVSGTPSGLSNRPPGSGDVEFVDSRLTLAAQIDNDGNLFGGIAQWTGRSEQLGIFSTTLLMTATVVGFASESLDFDPNEPRDYEPTELGYGFQFILKPTFVNAAIYDFAGDLYAYNTYDQIPLAGDPERPLDRSFTITGNQYLTYYLGPIDLPEPSMAAMFALSASLLMIRRRKRTCL